MRYPYISTLVAREHLLSANTPISERVKPNYLLELRNISITWDELVGTDLIRFFLYDGATRHYIGDDLAAKLKGVAFWTGKVYVPENWAVGIDASVLDAAEVETVTFIGVMHLLNTWQLRG